MRLVSWSGDPSLGNIGNTDRSLSAGAVCVTPSCGITGAGAGYLKIDPTTSDIVHDGRSLVLVADLDAIAQSLRTRLAFFEGEWFIDETFGVPYFQSILGVKTPLPAVREIFRETIAGTVGVLDILSLALTPHATQARAYNLTFTCNTDLGELTLTVAAGIGA